MGTRTINGEDFEVYGDAAGLASRANGSSTYYATYTAAVAADPDDVARKHVEATGLLSAMPFTDAADAVPATADAAVVTACYELVLAALVDDAALTQDSTAQNVKRLEAKGVVTEFFSPITGARFPARVMTLLGPRLGGGDAASGSLAGGVYVAGVSTCSDFDESDRYSLT